MQIVGSYWHLLTISIMLNRGVAASIGFGGRYKAENAFEQGNGLHAYPLNGSIPPFFC